MLSNRLSASAPNFTGYTCFACKSWAIFEYVFADIITFLYSVYHIKLGTLELPISPWPGHFVTRCFTGGHPDVEVGPANDKLQQLQHTLLQMNDGDPTVRCADVDSQYDFRRLVPNPVYK